MKTQERLAAAFAAALLVSLVAFSGAFDWTSADQSLEIPARFTPTLEARSKILAWPEDSRLLAQTLLEDLGDPDEVMPHYLSWLARPPFRTITVFADRASAGHNGILMHSVGYRVPENKWPVLESFGHGVVYDVVFNELVAYSDGQDTNILALNLADELVQGRRTVENARDLYDKTVKRSLAGRTSSLMTALQFDPKSRQPKN